MPTADVAILHGQLVRHFYKVLKLMQLSWPC